MTNEEAFVKELITYIFYVQDEDDDNLSSEIICRKLYKYGLIDKGEGGWTPKDDELDCSLCSHWVRGAFMKDYCKIMMNNPHWSCEFSLKPDIRTMPAPDGSTIPLGYNQCVANPASSITLSSKDPRIGEGVCYTDRTESLNTDCGWK